MRWLQPAALAGLRPESMEAATAAEHVASRWPTGLPGRAHPFIAGGLGYRNRAIIPLQERDETFKAGFSSGAVTRW